MQQLSPVRHLPAAGPPLAVAVGLLESDEFRRQSADYLSAWQGQGLHGEWLGLQGRNHFTALDALVEPGQPLHEAALALATST